MSEVVDFRNTPFDYICRKESYDRIADFLENKGDARKTPGWTDLAKRGIEYGLGTLDVAAVTDCEHRRVSFFDDFMKVVISRNNSTPFDEIIPELISKLRNYGADIERAKEGKVFSEEDEVCMFFRKMAELVGNKAYSMRLSRRFDLDS